MNTKHRIASILNTNSLDYSITELPSFDLSVLKLPPNLDYTLPTNLRLGHLAERVVSELINSSSNYSVLHENIQIVEDKQTVGELDLIIQNKNDQQITHVELAYKFYLYDPSISSEQLHNWIGPNRNDSLKEKLEKLKRKQLPLLYHPYTQAMLDGIDIDRITQALCFLVSLYVPYEYKGSFDPIYQKAVKGYYLNLESFKDLDHATKHYYIPPKNEWGMEPSGNENWTDFKGIADYLDTCMEEKQAPLCWQKYGDSYVEFFVVWW